VDAADHLNLKQVARLLGVHYMTAYRYVRQGRLPAEQVGGIWLVERDDLDAFVAGPAVGSGEGIDWAARLAGHLSAGDEVAAWSVLRAAADSGRSFDALHLEVLVPAVAAVGDEGSEVSDRLAVALAVRLVARLGGLVTHRGRKLGTVVVAAPEGEHHGLALGVVANLLRQAGFRVLELGTDAATAGVLGALDRVADPIALALSVTTVEHLDAARDLIAAVRVHHPDLPVLLGGQAVRNEEITALAGATAWSSGPDLVEVVADAARRRRRARTRAAR